LKIYGAGILSSAGETKFSLSDEPAHYPYGAPNYESGVLEE